MVHFFGLFLTTFQYFLPRQGTLQVDLSFIKRDIPIFCAMTWEPNQCSCKHFMGKCFNENSLSKKNNLHFNYMATETEDMQLFSKLFWFSWTEGGLLFQQNSRICWTSIASPLFICVRWSMAIDWRMQPAAGPCLILSHCCKMLYPSIYNLGLTHS